MEVDAQRGYVMESRIKEMNLSYRDVKHYRRRKRWLS